MQIDLVDEAREEFFEALAYYTAISGKLGRRFRETVESKARRIAAHPSMYGVRPGGYRRANLQVFPYYLAYVVSGNKA